MIQRIPKPERSKKIVVVGGGRAGLEAVMRASERGHKVVLFEATDKLGGQLQHADYMDFRVDLKRFKDFQIRQVEKDPNIEIRLNTKATPELVAKEEADGVIVAIGLPAHHPQHPRYGHQQRDPGHRHLRPGGYPGG